MRAEVVVEGILFSEGPVWCADGTLVVTSVAEGRLCRVWPDEGRAEVFVDTAGGPNGAAPTVDGGVVVAQNGGMDLAAFFPGVTHRPAPPGLQLAAPDGTLTALSPGTNERTDSGTGFRAPNDLVCAPDGTLYFTDPPHHPPSPDQLGRVWRWTPGADAPEVFAAGLLNPNGIGLAPDGTILIVERRGLMRLHADGSRTWLIEELGPGGGDGFAIDTEGFVYACTTRDHVVRVIDPADGRQVDQLEIDGVGLVTNCCFGGPDNRTLYATDAIPGTVVVWEGLPHPGLPLTPWAPPTV